MNNIYLGIECWPVMHIAPSPASVAQGFHEHFAQLLLVLHLLVLALSVLQQHVNLEVKTNVLHLYKSSIS